MAEASEASREQNKENRKRAREIQNKTANAGVAGDEGGAKAKAAIRQTATRTTNARNSTRILQRTSLLHHRLPQNQHQTYIAPAGKRTHLQWPANYINGPAAAHLSHHPDPTPAARNEFAHPPIVTTAPCTDATLLTMASPAD